MPQTPDTRHVTFPELDPDDVISNPSSTRPFAAIVAARLSRRDLIRTGTVVSAAGFLTAVAAPGAEAAAVTSSAPSTPGAATAGSAGTRGRNGLLGFAAISPSTLDAFQVPPGYVAEVIVPWGTPISSGGPAWAKDASNSAADQEKQVGMHHDGMHFFPLGRSSNRGLLVVNHEYIDQTLLHPDGDATMTPEKVAKALAAHGVSVLALARTRSDGWRLIDSPFNRRITGSTPVRFSGPVGIEHPRLRSNNDPLGTLNNCSHGVTPWGTYLTCEENWNGYFGTQDSTWKATPEQARYGITRSGFNYRWHTADPRFDLAVNPNELNRFGWVVEIDPLRPDSDPIKRTALGRIKHEGATVTESRGRVVVYTGDDQDGDYIYKFVGRGSWRAQRARGRSPLDHGTLYVARFNEDGSGEWLPLEFGNGPLTAANGWQDQADVLIRTRQAADALGATPMDRPEWIAVNPRNQDVYCTLTNGTAGPSAPNPRDPNPYGHIIRWREADCDNTATTFEWDIFLLAGDPAYDPKVELAAEDIFGSPDGLWFDRDGRLWIQTDISNSSQNLASRGYDRIGNNQMLAADPDTGEIRRFLVGPRGCEITGVVTTPDQRTMFVNVQHPGETTTAWGSPTPANPQAVSSWPDFDPAGRPRSATVAIRRLDGGVIGGR